MNNCNIPENLANRYGLATIGYIYDVNGTDVFNELNDYIKFHNIDYNTDDMFSVYNPSIFLPEYYNKYGYWMMLFKLNNNYSLTPFEKTIYNVKFDNNIDTLRDDYLNKRVYIDPTFNSNVKKDENVNILYRKIENKVYGFITPDNIIYLDKDSLNNPNTMFHEFYHLYDKILVNNSDESTQAYSIITRANELIVESGHLNEVQNDINYKHLSLELQQIEARARMIGDYAENKFNNNKISKLVNDIIEYIKSLFDKGTFDDYSNDEILKMNIVDFNDIVINEMINNDESIVSKDLNKVLLNKLKSVFKPYYKEVTFDKNKANSIRKEYEKRADIIYLNQVILDNITNNEYNIVEGSNWNLPYDNKLILDLLNSGDIEAINTLTKIIINDNPQLSDINIDNNDLIKYVAHNLTIDDIELLLSLDLNDKEFNDFITERNKKRIYNNTKHFYISVANNYNKYLEYNKLRNDETFKELYDNIDNNSILTPENSLYLYSIFNKEFKNKKEITQELNKYNIYKNYANSIQAMFIKEIEKNPKLDLNEVANNLFDNNNIKILNDNVNYFESRYPIWTNYVDIIPSTNIKLTNSTLNDILSVYTGELYFNDLLNYKGNISFNLTNILNKRIIDLFETDEMENDYIKNNVVSLVGNEIMNNAKFRNDIQSLFNKSMNKNISYGINFGVNGEYYKGLQNVRDFVTESLTNERFISYLKSLNVLEDVYNRIDFYTNINTQTNNLERNKELLQEKYQELIKLDVLLRNVNSYTIVELNDNNLVIDDNIVNLNDVGFRLTDENNDNIVDVLNKFSSKVLKEFSEFDYIIQDDVNINESQQLLNNLTVEEIEANRTKELEEFVLNIFPETVVKQVVYHGSEEKRDFYKGDVIFFSSDKNWASNFGQVVQSSVINLKNPFDAAGLTVAYDDENGQFGFLDPRTIKKEGLKDGIWGGFDLGQREGHQFTVFDSSQVHILTQDELNKIDEINAKYDKMLEDLNNSNEEILDKDKIDYQLKQEEVNYTLKAVDILTNEDYKSLINKGKKNNWTLEKTIKEISKEKQIKIDTVLPLLRDKLNDNIKDIDLEQLALDISSEYNYVVEINTVADKVYTTKVGRENMSIFYVNPPIDIKDEWHTIEKDKHYIYLSIGNDTYHFRQTLLNAPESLDEDTLYDEANKAESEGLDYIQITKAHFNEAKQFIPNEIESKPTQVHIKLSAKDSNNNVKYRKENGWEYQELSINTPLVENYKGSYHNPFGRFGGNYIGHIRVWYNKKTGIVEVQEIQSDFFQKSRDREDVIKRELKPKDSFTVEGKTYTEEKNEFIDFWTDENGKQFLEGDELDVLFNKWRESSKTIEQANQNQFLQLLNKNNNWVDYFLKAIISDSAKKGYEKILLPLGRTASAIEGQTTLEEFKRLKEERLITINLSLKQSEIDLYNSTQAGDTANIVNAEDNIHSLERERDQIFDELQQIEGPEGLAAFAPIHNFYENTITNILKKEGYNPIKITDEYGNQWSEITIDNVRDLKPILLQKGNIKPTSISILNKMADDFQSRYNITFKVIRESEAMRLLDKNNVPNAFYYEPTNTAYIVEGKANEISIVHELGHAFLYKIKSDNIKLYNNLVEEARNMPEITDYVNRVYGQISKDKYEQEVIMRAIDLYNQDKLDAKENKGLIDLITEFLLSISSYIKDLLRFERIDVNIIEPDTKLKDIADLLYLYKGNMNLSTKNKTQNFTYDERQNIRNIVNGNESEGIGNIAESARNYIVRSNKTIGGGSNNIGREKELLEEFLKENPQFIYDIDENPLGTQVAAGAQSKVYMSEDDTKYVYKKSWLTAHGGILENLTSILLHNMLFNNVEYEILGFYISDDFEKYNIILKQRFVLKEQMYNYDSIVEYLTHNHFIEKNGVFNNFDLKIKVTDLHPGNVYFANNKIFFIDPIVTTIPNSRDIHLGKVLEQLPAQEEELITVDEFYNKYQDKVINMLDIKKIENFNKDKGYAAINVIKRNDGKYIAIKNSEKVIQSDNNFIPTYQGLLSGNNPIKFYKTGNNYNINPLSNNTFYINEPVEIDEKGNAIIQDYNNIIPTNEIKTIINERFKDNNDYYLNNLLKDIKLSNYLTSEEADRYAEFIKNVNINRNQKYIIDIIDNKGFKKLNIMMESDNIVNINDNFSPTTVKAIEDKGLNIEEMNNPLLLSLQSLITNGELSEELTCKI